MTPFKSIRSALPLILIVFLAQAWLPLKGQITSPFTPVITQMESLEGERDPKCHATAARLEDFIYGTPLSFGARDARIDFQQQLVQSIWLGYTQRLQDATALPDKQQLFQQEIEQHFQYRKTDQGVDVRLPNYKQVLIPARDFRQYSTVAYALRAILSVQQSCLLIDTPLATLDEALLVNFKEAVDIAVLALLSEADQLARKANSTEIQAEHIAMALKGWVFPTALQARKTTLQLSSVQIKGLLEEIIAEKQAAYTAYNEISQAVFLRNIQVYFARVPWPKTKNGSDELKNHFNNIMAQYAGELMLYAQSLAQTKGSNQLTYEQMYRAVQDYLPHSINNFEDVTYFPQLSRADQTVIQSYDLDAFRDSGLHWQILRFVLEDNGQDISLLPDPFALEMFVEGIAQFAVYLFRLAGEEAMQQSAEYLKSDHLTAALYGFQEKLQAQSQVVEGTTTLPSISSALAEEEGVESEYFKEITSSFGLAFSHRNSDWLSRLIRGYVVKESENLARLAIPPAFGGGGIAAEDIDNDGWIDVLLLSGQGNRLLRNDRGQGFEDITQAAGLHWQRPDGTYGEARQPIIVDFDNDGKQDIFITYANDDHRIYRNLGNGQFEDLSQTAGLGGAGLVAGPATVIDYDRDGLLDIYIGYFGNYLNGELPTLKRHNTNASPNKLFRNIGNFRFEDVSAGSGIENRGWTQAVGHTDINGDGWQDLIAGNDFGVNAYYLNQQDGTFIDVSDQLGTDKPSYTMNVGVGDLNGDLRPDFYISNIVVMEKDDKYVLPNEDTQAHFDPSSLASMRVVEANDLFLSATNGEHYQQSTAVDRGYSATGWSWDADFFDFDNDSDLDLYCLTGMNQYSVYGKDNPYYTSPDGTAVAVNFANSQAEANILFANRDGVLNVLEETPLTYNGTSRSAAYLDVDLDGDLDVVVNEYQGEARIFENLAEQTSNNWTSIRLEDRTGRANRDAIGAQLIISLADGRKLWREIHSTTGYLSGHPKISYLGLGQAQRFDLLVRWPDGEETIYEDLKANEVHKINRI